MRRRDWSLRLEDILDAIARIQRYCESISFEEFRRDTKTVDAVVRNLEVIGEAARHIPATLERQHPEVPWSKMRGMRHVLAHEYFGIDSAILWQTVKNDLPPLLPLIQKVLSQKEQGG